MTVIDHWDVEYMMTRILQGVQLDYPNGAYYDFTSYDGKDIWSTHGLIRENPKSAIHWKGLVEPCWTWARANSGQGSGAGRGYGRISYRNKTHAVHRVSFNLWKGRLTAKQQVDHICNNRMCCNPHHLQAVTHKRNIYLRDMRRQNPEHGCYTLEETFT